VEEVGGRLKERMSPFCRGATTARDHVCDLDIVVIKRDGAHSKVEVAVVDERSILGRFAIKFRGFGELRFFAWSGRSQTREYPKAQGRLAAAVSRVHEARRLAAGAQRW
jgi:hypothetical protein